MSNIAFRDSSVTIIETGYTKICAILGLADLLKPPTVEIQARVGLRRSAPPSRPNGLHTGNSEDVNGATGSRASLQNARPHAGVNDYLVGQQLDDALAAGEDIVVSWPFKGDDIIDFYAAEALWKHVLFTKLGLKRTQNESPTLLTFPHKFSRDTHERVSQIFFERFNAAAVSILERPLAQLYAANALNGLVIDIGEYRTDIAPIYECAIHRYVDSMPIGLSDCEMFLAHLFASNQNVVSTLSPQNTPLEPEELQAQLRELAHQVWKEGLVKIAELESVVGEEEEGVTNIAAVLVAGKEKAVIETGMKKRANAKASAAEQARAREIEALDLITVEFKGKEVTIGKERHRFLEPLFDPTLLRGVEGLEGKRVHNADVPTIQDVCGQLVAKADLDVRASILDGLFVTGDCASLIKGIGVAIQSRLSPFILGHAETQNDAQPKQVRVLHVPEYFAEYRERGDGLAAFLGASIVAKVIFADPLGKNFASKADYTAKGPRAILEMSPCLL